MSGQADGNAKLQAVVFQLNKKRNGMMARIETGGEVGIRMRSLELWKGMRSRASV